MKLILGRQACFNGGWRAEVFPANPLPPEDADSGCDTETDTWLFDIEQDPEERENLAASRPEVVKTMRAMMREHAATSVQAFEAEPAEATRLCEEYASAHEGYLGPFMEQQTALPDVMARTTHLPRPVVSSGTGAWMPDGPSNDGHWEPGKREQQAGNHALRVQLTTSGGQSAEEERDELSAVMWASAGMNI